MNNDSDFLFTQFHGKEGSDIHKNNDQEEIKNILQQGISKEGDINEIAKKYVESTHNDINVKLPFYGGKLRIADFIAGYNAASSPSQTKEEDNLVGTFTYDHEKGEQSYEPNPNFGKPLQTEEEKVFTLKEALDIWEDGRETGEDVCEHQKQQSFKQQYFKEKFGIDI